MNNHEKVCFYDSESGDTIYTYALESNGSQKLRELQENIMNCYAQLEEICMDNSTKEFALSSLRSVAILIKRLRGE